MVAELLATCAGASVYHADHLSLLAALERRADGTVCDSLILDAPYSEKTQAGHADGANTANRAKEHSAEKRYAAGKGDRRKCNYAHWRPEDVRACVEAWSPVTRGWFVSITDDGLAPVWKAELGRAGRYVFATLPYVAPGSRVRMTGDGPSSWTCWIVVGEAAESVGDRIIVARPKTREFASWGTLPGAYVLPQGSGEDLDVVGGKPLWLMQRLLEDYSRPGDLICDPTCGAGTTLRAAQVTGRRAVGGDSKREHAEIAARRIREPFQAMVVPPASAVPQGDLF